MVCVSLVGAVCSSGRSRELRAHAIRFQCNAKRLTHSLHAPVHSYYIDAHVFHGVLAGTGGEVTLILPP